MPLLVDDVNKHQRLLKLLEQQIVDDCVRGREYIAQKKISGEAAEIPASVLATIEENTDIREAVRKELIERLRPLADAPMGVSEFYRHFALALSKATRDKEKYHSLFFGLIKTADMSPGLREDLAALSTPTKAPTAIVVDPSTTREELALMQYRAKTLNLLINAVFEAFFLAASQQEEVDFGAPGFREYAAAVNQIVYGDIDPSMSPPSPR